MREQLGYSGSSTLALPRSEGPATPACSVEYDHALAVLRDVIDADDLLHLMAAGAMMTEDEAIDQAHAIDRMSPARPDGA